MEVDGVVGGGTGSARRRRPLPLVKDGDLIALVQYMIR